MSAIDSNIAIESGTILSANPAVMPLATTSPTIKIKALHAETGEFQEKLLAIATGQADCLLGRHSSCDLVLDSAEVSRIHGRIWYQDGQCFFTDLGSTDGSQLNSKEVELKQVYHLQPTDLLRIGGFVLSIAQIGSEHSLQNHSPAAIVAPSSQPQQWSSGELDVRCLQIIAETHDVKTFRFVADPPVVFSYKPGQFVTLELEIDGKKVTRSYSISSSPSRPQILEFTVKRVPPPTDVTDAPPGLVSNWLHDNISVGSQVKLRGPMGNFTCMDKQAQKLLFISAGSGITPMMSMSRWLCDTQPQVDIIFIHSARSPRDVIYQHELESMAARYDNFKLAVTTTRSEPGRAWQGYKGRLNELMLQAIAPDFLERTVYVCGANPFMEKVKAMLQTLGFPLENYYQESFGSPKNFIAKIPTIKAENATVTTANKTIVIFSKSGKEISCDSEDTVLDVAEQEGIELPFGCRMGACGACKLPLIEGKVDYDDEPACEAGHLFTCIAKPIGKVVVEA